MGAHSETHPTNVGLVTAPYFWPDAMAQRMARKSLQLYSELAKVAGFRERPPPTRATSAGFSRCGRVYLASSDESIQHVRRIHSRSLVHNDENELVDCPSEMLARWPLLSTEDLQLALHSVEDVTLDNMALCSALADAAREHGAQIYENCGVKKVMVGDGQKVFAVDTEEGLVETGVFVNAAGIVSGRRVGAGVAALQHGARHVAARALRARAGLALHLHDADRRAAAQLQPARLHARLRGHGPLHLHLRQRQPHHLRRVRGVGFDGAEDAAWPAGRVAAARARLGQLP